MNKENSPRSMMIKQWDNFQSHPNGVYLTTLLGCVCISKRGFMLLEDFEDDRGVSIRKLTAKEIEIVKNEFLSQSENC